MKNWLSQHLITVLENNKLHVQKLLPSKKKRRQQKKGTRNVKYAANSGLIKLLMIPKGYLHNK